MCRPSFKEITFYCFVFYVASWTFDLISTTIAFNHYGIDYFIEHEYTQSIIRMFTAGEIPIDHIVLNSIIVLALVNVYFIEKKRGRKSKSQLTVGYSSIMNTFSFSVTTFVLIIATIFAVLHIVGGLSWWIW